jgi:hypothetical protein
VKDLTLRILDIDSLQIHRLHIGKYSVMVKSERSDLTDFGYLKLAITQAAYRKIFGDVQK